MHAPLRTCSLRTGERRGSRARRQRLSVVVALGFVHVLVWQALGRTDRALAELATVLSLQDPETGFVPHMGYFGDPEASVSSGVELAVRARSPNRRCTGTPWPSWFTMASRCRASLVAAARSGLAFLLDHRRRSAGGLIELAHPVGERGR